VADMTGSSGHAVCTGLAHIPVIKDHSCYSRRRPHQLVVPCRPETTGGERWRRRDGVEARAEQWRTTAGWSE